jgi:hypothetical protein
VINARELPAGRFLVDHLIPLPRTPEGIRRSAEPLLERFGATWADIVLVARVAPGTSEEAEAWLLATRTDIVAPGEIVDVTDSDWSATASTLFLRQQPSSPNGCTIHVAECATIVKP